MSSTTDVILRNGRPCLREFYTAVRLQAEDGIADLRPGKNYTARQLCGEPFWAMLRTPGLRQQAGRCLAHLVATGALPLTFASAPGKSPKRYSLPAAANSTARRRSQAYVGPIPAL